MTAAATMRQVTANLDSVLVGQAVVPSPEPGEALVQMTITGVCGSDTHAVHGRHPFIPLPYHPGHEVVGVVREVGADVEDVAVGDRVTVEPTLPCWNCKMCVTGRQNLCENLRFFGCGYEQGGMADYFTVPANRLHPIPAEFTDQQAILVEPLSTPVHAVRLAGDVRGKAVVIIGAGTIGLLVLAVVRAHGAGRVVVTDVLTSKRERALALGADAALDSAAPDLVAQARAALGESADVVFDCVAIQPTVDQAIAMALKAGTVVIVGVPAADVTVPLAIMQDQQVRLQGSATYLPEDYRESIELITAGAVRPEDFVTASFPLERVAEAFALSTAGEQVKVVVTAA